MRYKNKPNIFYLEHRGSLKITLTAVAYRIVISWSEKEEELKPGRRNINIYVNTPYCEAIDKKEFSIVKKSRRYEISQKVV